jgi:hypothetical protein
MATFGDKAEMTPLMWIFCAIGTVLVLGALAWLILKDADAIVYVPRGENTTTTMTFSPLPGTERCAGEHRGGDAWNHEKQQIRPASYS